MKAAIIEEPGVVGVVDVPDLGSPSVYQCLCRNIHASTCSGTDRKLIHNRTPWKNAYPAVLGHENVAEVTEVGSNVRNFSVHDNGRGQEHGFGGIHGLRNGPYR